MELELNSNEPEPVAHICARWDNAIAIEGSVMGKCRQCGSKIRMAPASSAHVEAEAAKLGRSVVRLCFDCASPRLRDPGVKILPWTDAQKQEAAKALRAYMKQKPNE